MAAQLPLPLDELETCWCCEKPGQLTPDPDGPCVNAGSWFGHGPDCAGGDSCALICNECAALIAAETPEDKEPPL